MQIQVETELTDEWKQRALLLGSRDKAVQGSAEQSVKEWEPGTIEALVAIARRENAKKTRRFTTALVVWMVLLTGMITAIHLLIGSKGGAGGYGGLVPVGLGVAAAFAPTRLQRRVVQLLSEVDDVRAIGPLLEALDKQDSASMKAAASALTRLLPRVEPGSHELLSESQQKLLHGSMIAGVKNLDAAATRDFALAAITACRTWKDVEALPNARKLAANKGLARKNADVQQAAKELVALLEPLEEEARERETLLRPAEPVSESALLRPAASADAEDTALLLRPGAVE